MPLFFFHLLTPEGREDDEVGTVFPDVESAYLDACRAMLDMRDELSIEGHDPLRCAFEIVDGRGRHLMELPFTERSAVAAPRPRPPAIGRAGGNAELFDEVGRLCRAIDAKARQLCRDAEAARAVRARMRDASFLDRIAHLYGIPD